MAFGFANAAQAHIADDLREITTERITFKALNGDKKVKLLPAPWPADALPPPTSSLMSVASGKGLVAAAGPNVLVIATTNAVRKAFESGEKDPNYEQVNNFTPQATISVPRVSQVAFSSDESSLVICAETGGGLAVYDVQAILQGNKESAFQLATNGVGVRALAPNPAKESAHIFAIVLTDGGLVIADLKQRQLVNGQNGPVLRTGVSCLSWSNKGKQLTAGLDNGTAVQLTPEGQEKAIIPKPPVITEACHVSTIYWLANDDWLLWYTPNNNPDAESNLESLLYLVHRDKTAGFSFHKLTDPCGPFGMIRSPPHHFIARLRDFPPNLNDMIIVASTASDETGVLTRASAALSSDNITNTFTNTTMLEDQFKAMLPIPTIKNDTMDDVSATSPIGLALDLSSTDKVAAPIKGDEIDYSPTPLPALFLLNNEGLLCAWWIVYADSIRSGQAYPGLVAAGGQASTLAQSTASNPPTAAPAFGSSGVAPAQSTFGGTFAKPAAPAFGQSGFSSGGGTSAFGGASALGAKPSPWSSGASTTAPAAGGAFAQPAFGSSGAFGKPAFGAPSAFGASATSSSGAAFGATGGLGQKQSPWGTQNSTQEASKPANPFGANASTGASPFGVMVNKPSGFAAFANKDSGSTSGFASLGSGNTTTGTSAFGAPAQQSKSPFATLTPSNSGAGTSFGITPQQSFGSTVTIGSSMGASPWQSINNTPSQPKTSTFGKPAAVPSPSREENMDDEKEEESKKEVPKSGLFGLPSGGFKLGSNFKENAKPNEGVPEGEEKDEKDAGKAFSFGLGGSLFGNGTKKAEPVTPVKQSESSDKTPKATETSTTPVSPPKVAAAPLNGGFVDVPKPTEPFMPPTKPAEKPATKENEKVTDKKAEDDASQLPGLPGGDDKDDDLPPLAGSPPVKVEAPSSDLSDEGEIEDDAPLPPDPSTVKRPSWFNEGIPSAGPAVAKPKALGELSVPKTTTPSLFGSRAGSALQSKQQAPVFSMPPLSQPAPKARPRSPLRSPSRSKLVESHTPAGFPKGPVFPQPTSQLEGSPRSPSPVRSSSTPIGRPISVPPARPVSRPSARPTPPPAPVQEPEPEPDVEDVEADRVRAELAAPIIPTKQLEPFLAYQDYAGVVNKPGIPGQVERVYRDINSMVDTLGLNARSIEAFVRGHKELLPENGRQDEDLEDFLQDPEGEEWALDEISDLEMLMSSMEKWLDSERIQDVRAMLSELGTLSQEVAKLRKNILEVKKAIAGLKDPEKLRKIRDAPLSTEQNAQLNLLRREFTNFTKRLAEAEEALSMLKAKIASAPSKNGGSRPTPTVEAVAKTIAKMTAMVEKKSGDIDVLEVQMRKLGLTANNSLSSSINASRLSSSLNGRASMTPGRASGESTPYATPTGGKGRYGFGYGSEIRSSPVRNELVLADGDELERVAMVRERRKKVLGLLRDEVARKGRKVTKVN